MINMLVRLYDLPDSTDIYRRVEEARVILRRPNGYERHILAHWVGEHFSPKWVSELEWPSRASPSAPSSQPGRRFSVLRVARQL